MSEWISVLEKVPPLDGTLVDFWGHALGDPRRHQTRHAGYVWSSMYKEFCVQGTEVSYPMPLDTQRITVTHWALVSPPDDPEILRNLAIGKRWRRFSRYVAAKNISRMARRGSNNANAKSPTSA